MPKSLFPVFALLLTLLLPLPLMAAQSLDALSLEINGFLNSPAHRFSPDTVAKAQALLGAAMMADRRRDAEARQQGMREAAELLTSAQRTARGFREKYATLLKLEQAARETAGNIPDTALNQVQTTMDDLIRAFEAGQFNESSELAATAEQQFKSVLRSKLPAILEKTDAALLAASRGGGKRYAPLTYADARQWLADALAYSDGVSREWPEHPRMGLKLAGKALALTAQVKQWRKKPGSYEQLVLQARSGRLQIAQTLKIPVDEHDLSADVSISTIVQRIKQLQNKLHDEKLRSSQQITALKEQYARQLEKKITALRNEMAQMQGQQMGELKEAFRAKLERETFETRRQQKLRKRFKPGEVEILANLDGSLLLRLSALQFASGRISIDKKHFTLLSRVRNALDLYPERKVVIEGHTDNRGDPKANQLLSLKRAETVRDFLIAAGMNGGRLKALGYGEVRPVASNDYDKGRAMNRRIDIIIQKVK
ncbi:MAG: OmpA family protein [Mariprofundaceae bacterium]|nr:OmpA family protein [Mariprofundaceae bacterium]